LDLRLQEEHHSICFSPPERGLNRACFPNTVKENDLDIACLLNKLITFELRLFEVKCLLMFWQKNIDPETA